MERVTRVETELRAQLADANRDRDEARDTLDATKAALIAAERKLAASESRAASARRLAFEDAYGLLWERADTFASQANGTWVRPLDHEARNAAARRANEWHEAARQVKALGLAGSPVAPSTAKPPGGSGTTMPRGCGHPPPYGCPGCGAMSCNQLDAWGRLAEPTPSTPCKRGEADE